MSSSCEGPCLPHCYCSPLVAGFAYIAIAYMGASMIYLVMEAAHVERLCKPMAGL
jgi:hypothetical protein